LIFDAAIRIYQPMKLGIIVNNLFFD
jgi:hypothetical protein